MVIMDQSVNYTPVKLIQIKSISETQVENKHTQTTNNNNTRRGICKCNPKCGIITLLLIALSAAISAFVVWKTGFLDNLIKNKLVILNGTHVYNRWVNPPVQPLHYIYLFNYTNVYEFENGIHDKLHLQEIGPYVYRQTLEKTNVRFREDNGTISFLQRNQFHFVPELSVGNITKDQIVFPNLSLLGAIDRLYTLHYGTQWTISTLISSFGFAAFIQKSAHDYLWGYEDVLFDMAQTVLRTAFNSDRIGLMTGLNGTSKEELAIYSGITDMMQLGIISEFRGKTEMSIWKDECNSISGSEGTMFPPSIIAAGMNLSVFRPEFCRKIPLRFQNAVHRHGLPAMRFVMGEDVFANADGNCYCEPGECPPPGVFDASKCKGAPVFISFPHFYRGAPELFEYLEGLTPDPKKHEFYMDIHKRFGVMLGGNSRLQVNVVARKTSTFPVMKMFKKDVILPCAWFDVVVDDLPEDIKSELHIATHTVTHGTMYFLLAVFLLSSSALAYLATRRTTPVPKSYPKHRVLLFATLQEATPCTV